MSRSHTSSVGLVIAVVTALVVSVNADAKPMKRLPSQQKLICPNFSSEVDQLDKAMSLDFKDAALYYFPSRRSLTKNLQKSHLLNLDVGTPSEAPIERALMFIKSSESMRLTKVETACPRENQKSCSPNSTIRIATFEVNQDEIVGIKAYGQNIIVPVAKVLESGDKFSWGFKFMREHGQSDDFNFTGCASIFSGPYFVALEDTDGETLFKDLAVVVYDPVRHAIYQRQPAAALSKHKKSGPKR